MGDEERDKVNSKKYCDIVRVDGRASVQFAARPMWFRIHEVLPRVPICGDGWVWLEGCSLSELLWPRQRREIFVRSDGLFPITDEQIAQIAQLRAARPTRTALSRARAHQIPAVCTV